MTNKYFFVISLISMTSIFPKAWAVCELEAQKAVILSENPDVRKAGFTPATIDQYKRIEQRGYIFDAERYFPGTTIAIAAQEVEQGVINLQKLGYETGLPYEKWSIADKKWQACMFRAEISGQLKGRAGQASDKTADLSSSRVKATDSSSNNSPDNQDSDQRKSQQQTQQNQKAQQAAQESQQLAQQNQTRADQERQGQRKTNNPAAQAHQCLEVDKDSALFGGFKNSCEYKVNYVFCNFGPKKDSWAEFHNCEKKHGIGAWHAGAGRTSAADTKNTAMVYWFACKDPSWPVDSVFVLGKGIEARCR